jgi:coenzyme F420-reducing hydrogenase beta subunit
MITLQRKADCCGCNACTQGCHLECISMQEDNEGFLYPKVDVEQCVDCGLCEKICPIINQTEARKPLHVYAAKNRNEEIRKQSSSGGIFTLLAEKIIEDGGVVFGARFDEKWEVMHDYTETKEGLAAFRGSKYLQSRTGNTFQQAKEFLKAGRKVLFSGTPCQIAGLKLFLRKEYDNLITIDFVCHGVPSPKVWRMYFLYLTDNQKYTTNYKGGYFAHTKAITEINFRDKTYGWKKFSLTVQIAMNPEIKTIQFRNKNKGWKKYYFYLR